MQMKWNRTLKAGMIKKMIMTRSSTKSSSKSMGLTRIDRAGPQADMSRWETEIDQLVCQLYGLTENDVKIVEGR